MEQEMIGNVRLDHTFYSGQDYYSDGSIEDDLLAICQKGLIGEALATYPSWPVLYHLSPIRQNIIEWYPMRKDASVLEIGAGCGAITGMLSQKAKKVTCIELSRKRSLINAWRNSACDNVEIYVGRYEDIRLDEQYDLITLIGVLEYAGSYTAGENPYLHMLQQVRSMLRPGGKILLAIENRMGLKYLNGAREDHTGCFLMVFTAILFVEAGMTDDLSHITRSALPSLGTRTRNAGSAPPGTPPRAALRHSPYP